MHITLNVLTRVPKLLRLKPSISKIDLYDNMLMDSGLQSLHQILLSNPQIVSIDIGCNDLSDGSMICLMDIIKNTNVVKIQLGYKQFTWQANHFSVGGLSQILSVIANSNRTCCLGLNGAMTRAAKKNSSPTPFSVYLSKLLKEATNLSTLNASNLFLNDSDQSMLHDGFSENHSLRHLNLSGNHFSQGIQFIEGIAQIRSLVYLNLSSCSLSTPSCIVIANAFSKGWHLISLDLSNNRIGSQGISKLFSTLSQNSTLTTLNLSLNNFDSTIEPSLRKFLTSNKVLASLDISKNHLSDAIAYAFADSLSSNDSLMNLNLSSCWITDDGIIKMAKSIIQNNTLKKLIFKDNFLSTKIGFLLLEILQASTSLLHIDLSSNQIDSFAIDAINSLCKRNRLLKTEEKFLPLRKEIIRLMIQKSKIPHVEEYLRKLEQNASDLDEANEKLQDQIEIHRSSTATTLKATRQAIQDFEAMILEEHNAIADMQKMMVEMEKETTKKITTAEKTSEADERIAEELNHQAQKIEKETQEFIQESDEEQQQITTEIEKIEKMLEDIYEMTRNKAEARDWEIPEFPYADEFKKSSEENLLENSIDESAITSNRTSRKKTIAVSGKSKKGKLKAKKITNPFEPTDDGTRVENTKSAKNLDEMRKLITNRAKTSIGRRNDIVPSGQLKKDNPLQPSKMNRIPKLLITGPPK